MLDTLAIARKLADADFTPAYARRDPGRTVSYIPARTAPVKVVRMATERRAALEGVPGGRINALSRLLVGVGRTPGETFTDCGDEPRRPAAGAQPPLGLGRGATT